MQWKDPEDCGKYKWTSHVKGKMRHYGLSASRVRRVINAPMRVEYGVAEDTVAVMQPQSTKRGENGDKTWTSEIWVMYQMRKNAQKINNLAVQNDESRVAGMSIGKVAQIVGSKCRATIISAWRYPGQTKVGESLPQEIWDQINESS